MLGLAAPAIQALLGQAARAPRPAAGLALATGDGARGLPAARPSALLLAVVVAGSWCWRCAAARRCRRSTRPGLGLRLHRAAAAPALRRPADPARRRRPRPAAAAHARRAAARARTRLVDMPEPGRSARRAHRGRLRRSVRRACCWRRRALRWRGVAARAERLRDLSIRQCLSLPFGTLVALLALIAWLEGALRCRPSARIARRSCCMSR